jgi:hypothetical protein
MTEQFLCGGDWLIDFADEALPAAQLALAQQHVDQCARCREELAALRHSGNIIQTHFAGLAAKTHQTAVPHVRRPASRGRRRVATALAAGFTAAGFTAAGFVAALMIAGVWQWRGERQFAVNPPSPVPAIESAPAIEPAPTAASVMEEIAREERKARLQATLAIVAAEPRLAEQRESLESYIREQYGSPH